MLKIFLIVFVISMIPLIELRGAIPVGVALVSSFLGLGEESLSVKYIVLINLFSMLGNMLPVPFIYFFARKFLEWGSSKKYIGKMCNFFLVKGKKGGEKLEQKAGSGLFFALFLVVFCVFSSCNLSLFSSNFSINFSYFKNILKYER